MYHNSLVLKWKCITWRLAIIVVVKIGDVTMTSSVQACIYLHYFYVSRYFEVACDWMIMTFWHVNWETCIIPIPKIIYFYLKPFSFSVTIKITKHCSYVVHICIQKLIMTIFMFSIPQKKIFDRWSCVSYQKDSPTRGYTLQKNARQYEQNCAYRS